MAGPTAQQGSRAFILQGRWHVDERLPAGVADNCL
jgi:hypothetical protein